MTGEQALQCVELAILRVRDRERNSVPCDMGLVKALDELAGHICELQNLERAARRGGLEPPPSPRDDFSPENDPFEQKVQGS